MTGSEFVRRVRRLGGERDSNHGLACGLGAARGRHDPRLLRRHSGSPDRRDNSNRGLGACGGLPDSCLGRLSRSAPQHSRAFRREGAFPGRSASARRRQGRVVSGDARRRHRKHGSRRTARCFRRRGASSSGPRPSLAHRPNRKSPPSIRTTADDKHPGGLIHSAAASDMTASMERDSSTGLSPQFRPHPIQRAIHPSCSEFCCFPASGGKRDTHRFCFRRRVCCLLDSPMRRR